VPVTVTVIMIMIMILACSHGTVTDRGHAGSESTRAAAESGALGIPGGVLSGRGLGGAGVLTKYSSSVIVFKFMASCD
jgi:hypothetical protein